MNRRDFILASGTLVASTNLRAAIADHISPDKHVIDITGAGLIPNYTSLQSFGGADPLGHTIRVNNYFAEMDGKPFPIIAGEFQPQRFPSDEWEQELLKIKAGAINTVSACFFWGMVEHRPNEFDFSGSNDIRRYAELCKKVGLYLHLRCGPFNNAEFLIGGMPPWLYGKPLIERSNDPAYLRYVGRYYKKLGEQLKNMFFNSGGPIIMTQLENELSLAPDNWDELFRYATHGSRGPTGLQYTKHMENLRELAIEAGMNPAIFTMTGWDPGGAYPSTLLPMYGGYMFLSPPGPNNSSLTTFDLKIPVTGKTPVIYCELGTGTPARISYRAIPPTQSSLATALTALGGTETISIGFYMYHGGSNPMNPMYGFTPKFYGLPLISYDFSAPIGEFGDLRETYYALRPLNTFLLEFGEDLAKMEVRHPDNKVSDPNDDRLRVATRAEQGRGFIFLSNYGNSRQLSSRHGVVLNVRNGQNVIRLPREGGLDIPAGSSGIVLPFNMKLGNRLKLVSATSQPLMKIQAKDGWHYFFFQPAKFNPEYVFDREGIKSVATPSGTVTTQDDLYICNMTVGRDSVIHVLLDDESAVAIHTLSETDARSAIKANFGAQEHILMCDIALTSLNNKIMLSSCTQTEYSFAVFPDFTGTVNAESVVHRQMSGLFASYQATQAKREVKATVETYLPSKYVIKIGGDNFQDVENILMEIDYLGDVCRIFDIAQGVLVADNLYNGTPWLVSLKRFRTQLAGEGLLVRVEPGVGQATQHKTTGRMILDTEQQKVGNQAEIKYVKFFPASSMTFDIS